MERRVENGWDGQFGCVSTDIRSFGSRIVGGSTGMQEAGWTSGANCVHAMSDIRNGLRRAEEIGIRIAMKCIDMWYPNKLSRPIGTLEASALSRMQIAVSGSLSARC